MFSSSRRNRNSKGFTLVEVIVVAVIVAVLALVGIQLYQGYVTQSRQNTAENIAAQASSFLQTVVNTLSVGDADALTDPLESGEVWTVDIGTENQPNIVNFSCPPSAEIDVDQVLGTVRVEINDVSSTGTYRYKSVE